MVLNVIFMLQIFLISFVKIGFSLQLSTDSILKFLPAQNYGQKCDFDFSRIDPEVYMNVVSI